MEKTQAQALAAVFCRVIDYYHTASLSREVNSQCEAEAVLKAKVALEDSIATALEAIPD